MMDDISCCELLGVVRDIIREYESTRVRARNVMMTVKKGGRPRENDSRVFSPFLCMTREIQLSTRESRHEGSVLVMVTVGSSESGNPHLKPNLHLKHLSQ